jgi:hypothetical protein
MLIIDMLTTLCKRISCLHRTTENHTSLRQYHSNNFAVRFTLRIHEGIAVPHVVEHSVLVSSATNANDRPAKVHF